MKRKLLLSLTMGVQGLAGVLCLSSCKVKTYTYYGFHGPDNNRIYFGVDYNKKNYYTDDFVIRVNYGHDADTIISDCEWCIYYFNEGTGFGYVGDVSDEFSSEKYIVTDVQKYYEYDGLDLTDKYTLEYTFNTDWISFTVDPEVVFKIEYHATYFFIAPEGTTVESITEIQKNYAFAYMNYFNGNKSIDIQ